MIFGGIISRLFDIENNMRPSFESVADTWLSMVAEKNNRSWRQQRRQLEMHVLPYWGKRPISKIHRSDVHELLDNLDGSVLPNRILALLKTIFQYACSRDWIVASPVAGVSKPRREIPRCRVLEMEEIGRVFSAAMIVGYPFGCFVQGLILTGQRRSEVAAMTWNEVNLAIKVWRQSSENKGRRAHIVPLSPMMLQLLVDVPRRGNFVFSNDGTTHVSAYSKGKRKIESILPGVGGAIQDWRFHDLRRSVATHMVRLGVSETVVKRMLNHSPGNVLTQTYLLHSYQPELQKAYDKWEFELARVVRVRAD
ncbi:tyrosine-type recombinase/integrase [Parasphingopyxis lamellibrachiae]|uniref:Site-specific recombinase XerD n=1 Tax=Parasphingopyxis lamellibrachiae TaxID=680125 RepID=A0A3D9FGC2_9SPHN|nr:tyrosine-type recombinase/integrase [Parasphingopyxis lamellibrachiae]RED16166.1 site-specific recombinase XerD [Parasphingopyxis lamellibrachiae]